MALTKATYGIQKLSGGRGYSVRPWITNPYTGKKEQIFKQSKKWTKDDAKKFVERIEKNPEQYFKNPNKTNPTFLNYNKPTKLSMSSTVDDLFIDYYNFWKNIRKSSTLEGYKISYEFHIKPMLGQLKLNEIDVNVITDWQHYLLSYRKNKGNKSDIALGKGELRNSSLVNIIVVLRNMFKHGFKKRGLPLSHIEIEANLNSGEQEHTVPHWSKDECDKFMQVVVEGGVLRDIALFSFLMVTGARRGEALALHPNKINFETKEVEISVNLTRNKQDDSTKTCRTRKVKLDVLTLDILKMQIDELKKFKDYDPIKTYVFSGANPLPTTNLDRIYSKYKAELSRRYPNIRNDVTLHGIRHSVATNIAKTLKDIKQASIYLNHTSVKTTEGYLHLDYNDDVINVVALNVNIDLDNLSKNK